MNNKVVRCLICIVLFIACKENDSSKNDNKIIKDSVVKLENEDYSFRENLKFSSKKNEESETNGLQGRVYLVDSIVYEKYDLELEFFGKIIFPKNVNNIEESKKAIKESNVVEILTYYDNNMMLESNLIVINETKMVKFFQDFVVNVLKNDSQLLSLGYKIGKEELPIGGITAIKDDNQFDYNEDDEINEFDYCVLHKDTDLFNMLFNDTKTTYDFFSQFNLYLPLELKDGEYDFIDANSVIKSKFYYLYELITDNSFVDKEVYPRFSIELKNQRIELIKFYN